MNPAPVSLEDQAERYYQRSEARFRSRLRNRRDERMIARALQVLPQGSAVLDLACGTGRFSNVLLQMGYHLFSLDRSWDMVHFIKRRFNEGSPHARRVVYGDASRLPYTEKSLDGIVSFRFLFHHLEDGLFEATLKEAMRVCRRHILFDVRLTRPILDFILDLVGRKTKDSWPLNEMIRRTENLGLTVERTVYINRYLSRKAVLVCRVSR